MQDDKKCEEKRLNISESIASATLLIFGGISVLRGVNWIIYNENPLDSEMYESLIDVAPLSFWGSVFIIGGALTMLASWFLPKYNIKSRFAVTLFFGGLITSVNYFIVAISGFNNALTWLTPATMIALSILGGVLAFFGGVKIWLMKKGS